MYEISVETNEKPTVLVGYCRGLISEGIDFPDHKCRLVVIVSIPHPSYYAPETVMKKKYLNTQG
jgi:regulator of telomere elongation helicase 1